MLLRLTTTCLCAAGVFLLATLPVVRFEIGHRAVRAQPDCRRPAPSVHEPAPQLSVIDAAEQLAPADLASLVPLKPGEQVTAINDRPLLGDLAAGAVMASRGLRAGEYLDLTVSSAASERRVLVLLH